MSGSHFEPRWRLDLDDDGTITFDRTTQTITKIKTGESCYLGDYPSFAVEEPRFCASAAATHRRSGSGTSPATSDYPRSQCQSAFGSGIPSLVENRASSWVDNPTETTDRSKNTSVRYDRDTAHRLTKRGMAYKWYMRVTNFAA